uniref:Uncharacterized protein n=1 Tax=Avena sativa TaxID=4498 RepID=A0ACD5ZK36_AVESA
MHGCKCLVNWQTVCHPKSQGGLGVMNLEAMNTDLQVRWAWSLRTEEKKAWCSLAGPEEDRTRHIFNAAANVVVGNGERVFFWTDKWLNGRTIEEVAPDIFNIIHPFTKAKKMVAQAIPNNSWIHDIKKPINVGMFLQVLKIWKAVNPIDEQSEEEGR